MENEWQKYRDMASGLVEATQKRAEPVVRALVKQGEIAAERAEKAVDDLLKRSESNRKAIAAIVRSETEKAVERLGLVRQRDITRLERKVEKLERQAGSSGSTRAKKSTTKKSSAAKRSAAKKSSAKKSSAKKSSAKKSARKTAAKKTAERAAPSDTTAPPATAADEQ